MKVTDLEFKAYATGSGGQAVIKFPNGFGASIVTGPLFYSSLERPYEIAVLDSEGSLTYDTSVTDNVCGYLTEDEANEILAQIEALD